MKTRKLREIKGSGDSDTNNVLYDRGRNLLSRMLSKSPAMRPSMSAILDHPFVSGKDSVRMVGDPYVYDAFISYRVSADAELAKNLHQKLTDRGLNVFWDKVCLQDGKPWEVGFCEGLVNSRVFVALISEDAVAHPTNDRSCFNRLTATSICDNVLLEHQLALELEELGMLEYIYPVMIGKRNGRVYDRFNSSCYGTLPDVSVQDVQKKLTEHMSRQALGAPLQFDRTVKATVKGIHAHQGGFIEGEYNDSLGLVVEKIVTLCRRITQPNIPQAQETAGNLQHHLELLHSQLSAKDSELALKNAEIVAMASELSMKDREIHALRNQLKSAEPSS